MGETDLVHTSTCKGQLCAHTHMLPFLLRLRPTECIRSSPSLIFKTIAPPQRSSFWPCPPPSYPRQLNSYPGTLLRRKEASPAPLRGLCGNPPALLTSFLKPAASSRSGNCSFCLEQESTWSAPWPMHFYLFTCHLGCGIFRYQ